MNKSTAMLLTLLLVLGAIVLLVLPSEEERMTSDSRPPVSFSVDSASVTGISIERPGKTLSVEKVGGVWTMTSDGDRRADPAAVGQVIGGLSRFRTGSLISDNPAKQGLFQVDSTGSLVTLTDREGNSTSIIIGKMGPSFSEVYFRMPGSSEVYLGTGITTWTLNRDPSEWRDRTVFASPAEALTRVKIVSAGRSQEFEKDSSGWMSGGQKVSTETMNPILTTLAGIRADDFIDSTVDFGTAPSTVEISGPASAKLNFYRLKSDTNKYAVVSSASPQTFIVGKHVASELFKSVGEPRAVSDPVVRRTASSGSPAATPRKPARTTTTPVESPPVTRRADPPPVTRDAVKTPVTGNPAAGTAAGAKTERAAETGAVNPFKQRPAGEQRPATEAVTPPAVKNQTTTPPARDPVATTPRDRTPVKVQPPESAPSKTPAKGGDDEGELTVHVVKKGETMTTIAKEYGVTVEQILKWNLLTSISVRPGQELYIFVRK
jgi:LysM repeat protein